MVWIKRSAGRIVTILLILTMLVSGWLVWQIVSGKRPTMFGYHIYHVVTGSMEPTIEAGGNVIVRQTDPEDLKEGDIITFCSRDSAIYGQPNTHKIVGIEKGESGQLSFVTKGDANPAPDAVRVEARDVYGKVIYATNAIKWFSLFFQFLHTRLGFMTAIVFPLMLMTYFYVRDFSRSVRQVLEDQAREEAQGTEDGEEGSEEDGSEEDRSEEVGSEENG